MDNIPGANNVTVPRWTPSPSPTRSFLKDQNTVASTATTAVGHGDDQTDRNFPFSSSLRSATFDGVEAGKSGGSVEEERNYDVGSGSGGGGGVYVTWKDVGVSVSDREKGQKIIVEGLTGYAEPGEVLAIMGPSGSGKSTFLDVLSGMFIDCNSDKSYM